MPLLEEVSDAEDIDNFDMDLAEFDPNLKTAIAPKLEKTIVRSQDSEPQSQPLFPGFNSFGKDDQEDEFPDAINSRDQIPAEALEQLKTMQLIYPCYFDKNRSHKEGRRVPKELAVENPLAHLITEACTSLHLIAVYEADKSHPQDWGNPGRVRVAIKHDGKPESILVNNKRHLLIQIAKYLQKTPATLKSIQSLPMPPDLKGVEAKEIPKVKGFKMNTIVPLFSKFTLGHPATKSVYNPREEIPVTPAAAQIAPKQPKNKYMHVRR